MSKCENCIHYDVCCKCDMYGDCADNCKSFKDKSLFVEYPCKIGDKMYFVCGSNIAEYEVYKIEYDFVFFRLYGENPNYVIEHREFVGMYPNPSRTLFLTKEEAERKLKEMENGK